MRDFEEAAKEVTSQSRLEGHAHHCRLAVDPRGAAGEDKPSLSSMSPGQVFRSAARTLTQLVYVGCAGSAYTGMPMLRCPEKDVTTYLLSETSLSRLDLVLNQTSSAKRGTFGYTLYNRHGYDLQNYRNVKADGRFVPGSSNLHSAETGDDIDFQQPLTNC
ncbi:hypothetical protein Bbelb_062330 [Branchiostoma belcheri]|nr:hypothetical protein Bbelb_062330 [Branchiostoma belcheri]